ncbi:MAG TPA: hypothetical protein V6D34_17405 [Candidatus Sericytochromatia bacterium]
MLTFDGSVGSIGQVLVIAVVLIGAAGAFSYHSQVHELFSS